MELENRPHCPKGIPGWPVNNWDNVVVKVFIPTDVWSVLYSSYWEYSFIVHNYCTGTLTTNVGPPLLHINKRIYNLGNSQTFHSSHFLH